MKMSHSVTDLSKYVQSDSTFQGLVYKATIRDLPHNSRWVNTKGILLEQPTHFPKIEQSYNVIQAQQRLLSIVHASIKNHSQNDIQPLGDKIHYTVGSRIKPISFEDEEIYTINFEQDLLLTRNRRSLYRISGYLEGEHNQKININSLYETDSFHTRGVGDISTKNDGFQLLPSTHNPIAHYTANLRRLRDWRLPTPTAEMFMRRSFLHAITHTTDSFHSTIDTLLGVQFKGRPLVRTSHTAEISAHMQEIASSHTHNYLDFEVRIIDPLTNQTDIPSIISGSLIGKRKSVYKPHSDKQSTSHSNQQEEDFKPPSNGDFKPPSNGFKPPTGWKGD